MTIVSKSDKKVWRHFSFRKRVLGSMWAAVNKPLQLLHTSGTHTHTNNTVCPHNHQPAHNPYTTGPEGFNISCDCCMWWYGFLHAFACGVVFSVAHSLHALFSTILYYDEACFIAHSLYALFSTILYYDEACFIAHSLYALFSTILYYDEACFIAHSLYALFSTILYYDEACFIAHSLYALFSTILYYDEACFIAHSLYALFSAILYYDEACFIVSKSSSFKAFV